MPKKFGTNTKKEEAKARVAEVKKSKAESERKAKEDLEWQDEDKLLKAKEDRKKENLEKKIREKERKEENKKIAEQETEIFAKKTKPSTSTKMTRAQIESARLAAIASMQAQIRKEEENKEKELLETIDQDINPNHIARNEILRLSEQGAVVIEGSGIDEAVNLLEEEKLIKHPEKKVKHAWNEYVENNLDRLKKENPSLKRSQLLGILHKEFEKSDKNPFNKPVIEYNAKIN